MTGVLQSGSVTPGHLATWVTDGVVGDGGAKLGLQTVIGSLLGADFNTTLDQAIPIDTDVVAFQFFCIYVTRPSTILSAAVGGFYPAASKAGTAIVANTQVYSTLTTAASLLTPTFTGAVITTRWSRANLADWAVYFSLTTPQGVAASADIYLLGTPLAR